MVDKNLAKACPQKATIPKSGHCPTFYSRHQTAPSEAMRRDFLHGARVKCITPDLSDTMRAVGPGENGSVLGWIGAAEGGGLLTSPAVLLVGG